MTEIQLIKQQATLSKVKAYYESNNATYEITEIDFKDDMPLLTIVADVPDKGPYTVALDLIEILTPIVGLFRLETPTREMWNTRRF